MSAGLLLFGTDLSREQPYRSFSEDGNPTLKTILTVMQALELGIRLNSIRFDLEKEEQRLLEALEAEEFESVLTTARKAELEAMATDTFKKDKPELFGE